MSRPEVTQTPDGWKVTIGRRTRWALFADGFATGAGFMAAWGVVYVIVGWFA